MIEIARAQRQPFLERLARQNLVEGRHVVELDFGPVHPDARDPLLPSHRQGMARPLDDHDDLAGLAGGAEQEHVRAGEAGRDLDDAFRQVGDQSLGLRLRREIDEDSDDDQELPHDQCPRVCPMT